MFATVSGLSDAGAVPLVHDPMYSDQELVDLGFTPYHLGDPVDAAVLQADHVQYRDLTADQVPARSIVDGRRILDPAAFPGVTVVAIGAGT